MSPLFRVSAILALTAALALTRTTSATSAAACDYSFLLQQPIFQLVAPEESGVDVSLATPLAIASQGHFDAIRQVELIPESGPPIVLSPRDFKPFHAPAPFGRTATASSLQGQAVETLSLPRLKPSTTYQVVLTVRTLGSPPGCPKVLTEHIARFTTESATSLDAIALSHEPPTPPTGTPLTGAQIFDNALRELRTFRYPPIVSFMVTTRSTINGKPFEETFRSLLRTSDDVVITHAVPVMTTNRPENPWGFRVNIPLLGSLFPSQRKGNYSEPFGVPEISPIYSFNLLPRAPITFPGMPPPDPQEEAIRSLGRILTIARDYDATLLDVEKYGSRYVYHLKLTPVERPDVFRLREAWIDTQAFVIWKLRSAGIFDEGPATTVPWDITYTIVDGHWFMASESTTSTIRTGGFLANTPQVNYDGISYTFSDFTYPQDVLGLDFFSEVKTQAIQN
jgi:hypothetical protein